MNKTTQLVDMLRRSQGGDERAAQLLFERYSQRLTALAEKRLSRKLAVRVDGEDIVQSVFRTFFARSAQGQFHIANSVDIWHLLVEITITKVRAAARRHTAAKRDIDADTNRNMEAWLPQVIAAEPGPADAAALVDQIDSLLRDLPSTYGEILALRLEGHSRATIAQQLNISRQTVRRALALMQQRLQRDLNDVNPPN